MMGNLQREAWYVGNLAGVPIFVHWTALLLVLLVAGTHFSGGATHIILVLIALILGIVLHELGHGLTARAFGATGLTITLWAFGGLCSSRRDPSRIGREMLIVAAGPAVSLALWVGCLVVLNQLPWIAQSVQLDSDTWSLIVHALKVGAWMNMTLFIFNMMPIYPMDGGQLVYYGMLGTTRNLLLTRQVCLFLAVFGAIAFFLWHTGLFTMMGAGGTPAEWAGTLGVGEIFLAILLVLMVRSAFHILY
jgi:Zn-dependent protease